MKDILLSLLVGFSQPDISHMEKELINYTMHTGDTTEFITHPELGAKGIMYTKVLGSLDKTYTIRFQDYEGETYDRFILSVHDKDGLVRKHYDEGLDGYVADNPGDGNGIQFKSFNSSEHKYLRSLPLAQRAIVKNNLLREDLAAALDYLAKQ